jgi:hypothetical protein
VRAAVAGWQWLGCRWIEEISAVILVLVTYHGCGCGGGWVAVELGQNFISIFCWFVFGALVCVRQWRGGSGWGAVG